MLFAAAYLAEEVRGGLQALPRGQYEGAMALGLGYWRMTGLVILPQALTLVIPGIVNNFIGLFKDTTLVASVGMVDFLAAIDNGLKDPAWSGPTLLTDRLRFRRVVLFRLLLCDVALLGVGRAAAGVGQAAIGSPSWPTLR